MMAAAVAASIRAASQLSLALHYVPDNKFSWEQYENSWYYVNCLSVLV